MDEALKLRNKFSISWYSLPFLKENHNPSETELYLAIMRVAAVLYLLLHNMKLTVGEITKQLITIIIKKISPINPQIIS